ncbi:MAG TPA: hypothetical protein VK184_00020 [Nostocaceae cyanobacterium]|nr:hypothetical protein [Nostocaceae cyanobacterium]
MNTNVLLVIIIVLMTLGFVVQLITLAAIAMLPENFIKSVLGMAGEDEETEEDKIERDILDVEALGFGKSKKSKSSRASTSKKNTKKSTNDNETTTNAEDVKPLSQYIESEKSRLLE